MTLAALIATSALAGCGHCGGALRSWFVASCVGTCETRPDDAQPIVIRATDSFRMRGDCRGGLTGEALLQLSGVSDPTWYLVDEAGRHVATTITADSGGSLCLNGVGFNLRPQTPLKPGAYALVLLLDEVRWPFLANDVVVSVDGHRAVTRRYRVE